MIKLLYVYLSFSLYLIVFSFYFFLWTGWFQFWFCPFWLHIRFKVLSISGELDCCLWTFIWFRFSTGQREFSKCVCHRKWSSGACWVPLTFWGRLRCLEWTSGEFDGSVTRSFKYGICWLLLIWYFDTLWAGSGTEPLAKWLAPLAEFEFAPTTGCIGWLFKWFLCAV